MIKKKKVGFKSYFSAFYRDLGELLYSFIKTENMDCVWKKLDEIYEATMSILNKSHNHYFSLIFLKKLRKTLSSLSSNNKEKSKWS